MTPPPATALNPAHTLDPSHLQGVSPVQGLGVLRALGPDAANFLHNQLTQDFLLLGPQQARLAAYCNAQGRMQASCIGFKRAPDEVLLLLSHDLLGHCIRRLGQFVLRANVKLSDASADFALWGVSGAQLLPANLEAPVWSHAVHDGAHWVRLPEAAGQARAVVLAPPQAPQPAGPALASAVWDWLEVQSGVATLTHAVFEAFVPQMLNYESVGGVNFKKGCYPGQEVVARSQFRGTLKRRAYLLHSAAPDAPGVPGQDVFHATDSEQACGTVVMSAPNPTGGHDMLVSMQVSAADGQGLTLGLPEGPGLSLRPLPYVLLADV